MQSRVEESSISSNANPNPEDDKQDLDNIEDQGSPSRYKVKNVKRRERRAKSRIEALQQSLNYYKRVNKTQQEKMKVLSSALQDTQSLVRERNEQIRTLEEMVRNSELAADVLHDQKMELGDQCAKELEEHEAIISELTDQLQDREKLAVQLPHTFSSRAYSTNVRTLYYMLLSMRLPPAQIKTVVRNVISHLFPSIQAEKVRLPGKSCASYMRREEMPTISRVQKHSELLQSQEWHLNSDGTTLQQQKKVAFLINGMVLGVHDVHDGSAQVALDALNAELTKTSKVDSTVSVFNIERIVSSTSDAASTQTKFTHLIEEKIGKEVVENKCSMHLGVNLRAAQVKAASSVDFDSVSPTHSECSNSENDTSDDESDDSVGDSESDSDSIVVNRDIDLFVHETAKLFGHLGTPEYACGASFRIFLEGCTGEEKAYYESAQKVTLERQIGSRYYVTSRNAGCIYFLRSAMITFLHEKQLFKSLNRLESTCLRKLKDPVIVATLKLEGLMFDKVYADLMILVKSTKLNKSSLDMNIHYEELLAHLESLSVNPESILDSEVLIFKSERSLYSDASKLNHRLTKAYVPVREKLYESHDSDEPILFPLVLAVSTAMHSKLQSYKKDHLPGGCYYDPDPDVKAVLSKLQPHNDRTESVFGANDWLCRLLPNNYGPVH